MKRYFDYLEDYLNDFISDWDYDISKLESYKCTRHAQNFARFAEPDDEVYDEDELFVAQAREVYDAIKCDGFWNVFKSFPVRWLELLGVRWQELLDDDSERAEKILNRANQVILNIIEKWI